MCVCIGACHSYFNSLPASTNFLIPVTISTEKIFSITDTCYSHYISFYLTMTSI